ncbi:hypothetical protein D9M71_665190 [compost metagenome]
MDLELRIDHGVGVIAHAAGAHGVEDRGADARGGFVQLFLALKTGAGQVFHWIEGAQGRRGDDAPGQANGVGGDPQVLRVAQVIGLDQRGFLRIGRADFHPATALRAQITDRGSERREGMQRFAKALQRQRLHVVFEVG